MQGTVLMALLQPAPEVYELFDDILLMAEGHIIFHGPKEGVLPFFEAQGFKLPPRKGIADFLQEVGMCMQPLLASTHDLHAVPTTCPSVGLKRPCCPFLSRRALRWPLTRALNSCRRFVHGATFCSIPHSIEWLTAMRPRHALLAFLRESFLFAGDLQG